jgi:hypothetical protein
MPNRLCLNNFTLRNTTNSETNRGRFITSFQIWIRINRSLQNPLPFSTTSTKCNHAKPRFSSPHHCFLVSAHTPMTIVWKGLRRPKYRSLNRSREFLLLARHPKSHNHHRKQPKISIQMNCMVQQCRISTTTSDSHFHKNSRVCKGE